MSLAFSPAKARQLMANLGYDLSAADVKVNLDLLQQALSHRSASSKNNERLEFLGDSVLGLVISRYLFEHLPKASEGELTRIRAKLVCERKLAALAKQFCLSDYLILGPGEQKSGGAYQASIMADALEAIIAVLYLSLGWEGVGPLILKWYAPDLAAADWSTGIQKDAKTRLQEALQSEALPLPVYQVLRTFGDQHDPSFEVSCHLATLAITTLGRASTRKHAEQAAAEQALQQWAAQTAQHKDLK